MNKEDILKWNNMFPIDRWWRQKHKVPFMSEQHKNIRFTDQLFEYKEDKFFDEYIEKLKYEPNKGDFLIKQLKTVKERTDDIISEARKELSDLPDEF
jgi:endonuclease III